MEKLHFEIVINAPKEKVWDTMLQKDTYIQWTRAFNPDDSSAAASSYEGDWNTGSSIKFLGSDEHGAVSGMISRIKENRPHDFVSIQHLGVLQNGQEQMWTEAETGGREMLENYTFEEVEGGTRVRVDLDTIAEYKDMFQAMWPKALENLKELAEK